MESNHIKNIEFAPIALTGKDKIETAEKTAAKFIMKDYVELKNRSKLFILLLLIAFACHPSMDSLGIIDDNEDSWEYRERKHKTFEDFVETFTEATHDAQKSAIVQDNIDLLAEPQDWSEEIGYTSLHNAAARGDEELLRFIVHGLATKNRLLTVDCETASGATPLHLAALKGHHNTVRYLLSRGADPNKRDKGGNASLHYAVLGPNSLVVRALAGGNYFVVEDLTVDISNKTQDDLEREGISPREGIKAQVDVGNINNFTPLHGAAKHNKDCSIQILIDNFHSSERDDLNAFLNQQTTKGRNTALHFAAYYGCEPAVRRLLDNKASTNLKNASNKLPQELARLRGNNAYEDIAKAIEERSR